MNKAQLAKLDAVIAYVENNPDTYDQEMFCYSHACETKFCIAGHLIVNEALMHGFNINHDGHVESQFEKMTLFLGGYASSDDYYRSSDRDHNWSICSHVAAKIIGLDIEKAVPLLFDGMLTLDEIKKNRDKLAKKVQE